MRESDAATQHWRLKQGTGCLFETREKFGAEAQRHGGSENTGVEGRRSEVRAITLHLATGIQLALAAAIVTKSTSKAPT